MKPRQTIIAIMVAALLALPSVPFARSTQKLPQTVQDLYYGVGLYYFFQDKYFDSITRLRAAQLKDQIDYHAEDTELLIGGMYMNYGMHLEAQRIFHALLDQDQKIKPRTRDRAWFLLGQGLYERGFYREAADALKREGPTLSILADTKRRVLLGNSLIQLRDNTAAETVLREAKGNNPWHLYARFNRGVALMNLEQTDQAINVLARLGEVDSRGEDERRALRDKANLSLGFHFGGKAPEKAKDYFEKIRVKGLLSNRALLGIGWTYMELEQYKAALVPWLELAKRDVHDSAVLEVYLAIPAAFDKLRAYREALQQYQAAIDLYESETAAIEQAIKAVKAGRVLESLVEDDDKTGLKAELKLRALPKIIENHYLIQLISSHQFQSALKSYLNMRFLQRNLQHRARDIEVFNNILSFRRKAYEERLPGIMKRYRQLNVNKMHTVRDRFARRLAQIEKEGLSTKLATQRQKKMLEEIDRLRRLQLRLSNRHDVARQGDILRMMRGKMLWDVYTEHPVRLEKAQRRLVELDLELGKAEQFSRDLVVSKNNERNRLDGFHARLSQQRNKLHNLQQRLPEMIQRHETFIADMAVVELEKQLKRLDIYLTQARLGVAQIYDRARELQAPSQQESSEQDASQSSGSQKESAPQTPRQQESSQ